MSSLAGIHKDNRVKLALLIRGCQGMITVENAANILKTTTLKASEVLSQFVNNGWLARIKRGAYVALPIESQSSEAIIDDAWAIAAKLFEPCYIGGWSALEHWGLTEQIFYTNFVFSSKKFRNLTPEIKGAKFLLRFVQSKNFFGLKQIWRGSQKVQVSDPSRTIIDILSDPSLAGGIRPVSDVLLNYFNSAHNNPKLLIEYADKLGNKAVFKRLGFLLEQLKINNNELLTACSSRLSAGNAQLDPKLKGEHIVTRWRLWIPTSWKQIAN